MNGTNVTLQCEASGYPAITGYLWKKNGIPIPGANTNYININPVTVEDVGIYECFPQSPAGTFNSSRTQMDIRCKQIKNHKSINQNLCVITFSTNSIYKWINTSNII